MKTNKVQGWRISSKQKIYIDLDEAKFILILRNIEGNSMQVFYNYYRRYGGNLNTSILHTEIDTKEATQIAEKIFNKNADFILS